MHTRVPDWMRARMCTQHELLWLEEAWQLLNLQLLFSNLRLIAETPEDFDATPDDSKQTRCLEHNLLSLPSDTSSYSSTCLLPDEAWTPGDTATMGCSFHRAVSFTKAWEKAPQQLSAVVSSHFQKGKTPIRLSCWVNIFTCFSGSLCKMHL